MRLKSGLSVSISVVYLLLTNVGCAPSGPQTYPVSGTVTYDGEPVAQGDILFVPMNRSLAPDAGTIENGRFRAQAKEGECRVEISALNIGPDTKVVMGSAIATNFIPERYNRRSELRAEVSATDDNVYDFKLTSSADERTGQP